MSREAPTALGVGLAVRRRHSWYCFLAIKPNQPEDDGEYGVPDVALPNVALPNVALPIACCLTKNPQSARPLVRGHEREANGTKQDERGDHGGRMVSQPGDYVANSL
jgi:hypothetical protein